jgi:hypothetical protein
MQGVPNKPKIVLTFALPGTYTTIHNTPCSFGERAQGRSEKDGPCFFWCGRRP